jgi:hypothetical protein|tara:strand:- start:11230 stop:12663 length:1434 start_codon:yes stop_codon:yes gene_type:complete
MKSSLLILTFALLSSNLNSQIIWGNEVEIGDAASNGIVRPRLALTDDNRAMVIMTRIQNGQIYFTQEVAGNFTTPIPLLPSTMQSYIANWTGPDTDVRGDTIVVVFKAMPFEQGHVYSIRSADGGLTFSDTIRVDNHMIGRAWMPSMAMDNDGNPLVTYMVHDANSTNPRYVYSRSTDAGLTYTNEQEIASNINGEACDCCPAEMVSSGNKQVLLFRNNETNVRDIYGVYSNDNGATFGSNDNIDETNWLISSCPASGPHATFIDTSLYTIYMSAASGTNTIYLSKSKANNLLTFENRQTVSASPNSPQNFPRIASENNVMVAAWSEYVSNNYEIVTAISLNENLAQFSTTNQQANSNSTGTQTNPDIQIKNGVIHLVYQDLGSQKVIYKKGLIGLIGLEEESSITDIIYPNPISANQEISLPKELSNSNYHLFDMSGKEVHLFSNPEGKLIIPLIDNGMYLLYCEKNSKTYQLIIQ